MSLRDIPEKDHGKFAWVGLKFHCPRFDWLNCGKWVFLEKKGGTRLHLIVEDYSPRAATPAFDEAQMDEILFMQEVEMEEHDKNFVAGVQQ